MDFTTWPQSVGIFVSGMNAHQRAPTAEESVSNSGKR